MSQIKAIIEALLFVADEPLERDALLRLLPGADGVQLEEAISRLKEEYGADGRGVVLREIAGGILISTREQYDDYIRDYYRAPRASHLSQQALETLAIIAYEQPISTPEIRELRGADPGGVLRTLLERKLIKVIGRKEVVGRPFLYATTNSFLMHFGLRSLDDLPKPEEFAALVDAAPEEKGENQAAEQ